MNCLYTFCGISKQAFHQYLDRQLLRLGEQQQLLPLLHQLRQDHPAMSARKMYLLLKPVYMGRDRFEQFCFQTGFKLSLKRSPYRTTNSLGVTRFDNLLSGLELKRINQAWVSDITYYRLGETFYYLTFITDMFSRTIVGYAVSDNMLTENTTIPALNTALAARNPPKGLILHSDGGGQYYSKALLAITKRKKIKNSMAGSVYENPTAERINGIIKNEYLLLYSPQDYKQLVSLTQKAVRMYNQFRPHLALNGISPCQFEMLPTKNQVVNKEKRSKKEILQQQ